ncbi:hypothetical protein [Bradyrhizobium sp. Leo170]|uniref:hypothetical protein n=1 Tax=Bradyrhizobium sp. Leo170 TaxID=1571199 RepID=UPI00102E7A46|nr:hypothetical protein [Bradyrhizobium sp. Leo170]TAI63417.1 hypothetical protein CWO89_24345 [Bradyrhizobium sp. Leo170]
MNTSSDEFAQRLRAQLDQIDQDEQALRAAGRAKQAGECARRSAAIRRQLERYLAGTADRRAASDARAGGSLRELVDGIERRLAECDFALPDGGPR